MMPSRQAVQGGITVQFTMIKPTNFSDGWWVILVLGPLVGLEITARAQATRKRPAAAGDRPAFALPALPYAQDVLEPHLSARTISIHYGKHYLADWGFATS